MVKELKPSIPFKATFKTDRQAQKKKSLNKLIEKVR